jgi:hypothetical protein
MILIRGMRPLFEFAPDKGGKARLCASASTAIGQSCRRTLSVLGCAPRARFISGRWSECRATRRRRRLGATRAQCTWSVMQAPFARWLMRLRASRSKSSGRSRPPSRLVSYGAPWRFFHNHKIRVQKSHRSLWTKRPLVGTRVQSPRLTS